MITSFSLDRFDDDTSYELAGVVKTDKKLLDFSQTLAILFLVLDCVILEWVLVTRETGDRPVERRNVQLVNGFRMGR
jgi:hypothetical protein